MINQKDIRKNTAGKKVNQEHILEKKTNQDFNEKKPLPNDPNLKKTGENGKAAISKDGKGIKK